MDELEVQVMEAGTGSAAWVQPKVPIELVNVVPAGGDTGVSVTVIGVPEITVPLLCTVTAQ